jgi:catechol 2,3-dioxygenase-like lactoylglutathione lyase family enzyme
MTNAAAQRKSEMATLLSHIEINVSNYAKSIRFYDLILAPLGWRRLVCTKDCTTFTDGDGMLKIVLSPTSEKHRAGGFHRKRVGLNHLAFAASAKEKVDDFWEQVLKKNGIATLYEGHPSGSPEYYAVLFEDPDRIKIEVVYAPGYCQPNHWTNQLASDFDPFAEAERKAPSLGD